MTEFPRERMSAGEIEAIIATTLRLRGHDINWDGPSGNAEFAIVRSGGFVPAIDVRVGMKEIAGLSVDETLDLLAQRIDDATEKAEGAA